MSFWKNAFVFSSGAVVGAAGLTAFAGYKAYKMLKKNDTLYSAVEESVKAGVHTGGNELGNRLVKIVTDKIFDQRTGHDPAHYRNVLNAEDAIAILRERPGATMTLTSKGYEISWET